MPITIRRYTPADVKRLVEIGKASLGVDAPLATEILRMRRMGFAWSVAAELDGEIIAFMTTFTAPAKRHIVAHVAILAVDPAYRRQGVGRALVEWSFANLRAPAITMWELEVRSTNTVGLQFWQNFGFVQVGVRPRYYRDKADAIYMRKTV